MAGWFCGLTHRVASQDRVQKSYRKDSASSVAADRKFGKKRPALLSRVESEVTEDSEVGLVDAAPVGADINVCYFHCGVDMV